MIKTIRRFQQPLMIAVTLVIIVAFTWLYNDTQLDKMGSDQVATVYGRAVSFAQVQKIGRKFELCQDLGLMDLLQALAIRRQDGKENFVWNNLVLQHEAAALGLEPADDEVLAAIQAMPVFRTNGAYDSTKYNLIVQRALTPRGFSPNDMEDLIRDDLRLKKIKALLGATVVPPESEVRAAFDTMQQKTEASVIRLKLDDFLTAATAPDEDVKKLYEERKPQLKSDERRSVKFVALILPTTDKPLEPKARVEALSALQKQAEDFTVAMTEKDAKFEEVAARLGVKVDESANFARTPPLAAFGDAPAVSNAAFRLSQSEPHSDVIDTDRGYFVLQLSNITPAQPLTFDEAKAQLAADLKRERAQEALGLKGAELRNQIDASLKAGKSFAEAAQAAGVKAETVPAFSRSEPKYELPDAGQIMGAAFDLKEGQLSAFTPTATGGLLVHVDKRPPIDDAKFQEEKPRLVESIADFKRTALFQEWLKLRRAAANLQLKTQG